MKKLLRRWMDDDSNRFGYWVGGVIAKTVGYYECSCCGRSIEVPLNWLGALFFPHDSGGFRVFE